MGEPSAVATSPGGPPLPPPPPRAGPRMTFGLRPLAVGGMCLLIGGVAAALAFKTLWPWPPRNASGLLSLLVLLAGVAGVIAGSLRSERGRRRAVSAAIGCAAVIPFVAVTVVPGIAQPRSHPIPGGQAYVLYAAPDGNWDLYWMPNGDAAGLIALTATDDVNERWPVLAPDARSLIYTRVNPDGSTELRRLDLQPDGRAGTDEQVLPSDGNEVSASTFAPDGTLLVEVIDPRGRPSIDRLDLGTGALTPFLPGATTAAFSPDGTRLAFTRQKRTEPWDWDIWVSDASGHHAHDVIDAEGTQALPIWSPDGTSLAFSGQSPVGDNDVFVARADGTGVTDLTPSSRYSDTAQGWTPDGRVLFLSNRSHTGGTFLYFMNTDGSDVELALRI